MLHKEDKTEMKKKRALRILSLILLCALTFTACKKNVGTPEDNAASKDENTEEKSLIVKKENIIIRLFKKIQSWFKRG